MRSPDPFGRAVLDFHRGKQERPCMTERDDGYVWREPMLPYFVREQGWTEKEREILYSARPRALDIGCGPGRHLLDLQDRLFAVGLDVSEPVLRVCKERGGRNLVLGSARRLPFKEGAFGTVLLMSNGLGILGGIDITVEMLREARRALSDLDGNLIAHTTDPLAEESGVGEDYISKNESEGRPPGLLRIRLRYGDVVGPWFSLMLLTPEEVEDVLDRSGFEVVREVEWGPTWAGSQLYLARVT
jgi:SAM-dependent methyltransferase